MPKRDIHYGWLVSPYSAKTRSYLRYTGINFEDVEPTVLTMLGRIKPAVGRMIMPTVCTADGLWLQDSSVIIDHYEQRRTKPLSKSGTVRHLAARLLEVFADEWLPMAALHYRWHIEANARFARDEFARSGLPFLPRCLGRPLINGFARKMQSYLPMLGVDEKTIPGVESTVILTLDTLEHQLGETDFVLGPIPTIGDFALFGPLWAHLFRDPGSRYLFKEKPNVVRWLNALRDGAVRTQENRSCGGVSAHLDALFATILRDQWAWHKTLVEHINDYCKTHPHATRVPRALGTANFQIDGLHGVRKLITSVQWKAQRARAAYEACNGCADDWLRRVLSQPKDADVSRFICPIDNPMRISAFKPILASERC